MKRQRIEIKSAYDLKDIMDDMFTEFLESLVTKAGMTRKPNYDDDGSFADEVSFIYTQKAMVIIDRYKLRMKTLFKKYYPDSPFNLTSGMFIER